MIVRRAVSRHSAPEHCFGRKLRSAKLRNNLVVPPFGLVKFFSHECEPPEGASQCGVEVAWRQVAFESKTFLADTIKDKNRRHPDRVEPMEPRGVLLDVRFDREELRLDELGRLLIGVRLGFRPSACASSRRGAEIDQQWMALLLGACE